MPSVFSVPIFFVVLRDTLQAALILAVLFSFVKQLLHKAPSVNGNPDDSSATASRPEKARATGFVGVYYTQANDLWMTTEQVWEGTTSLSRPFITALTFLSGVLELLASLVIFVLGVTMLKVVNAPLQWRTSLYDTYNGDSTSLLGVPRPLSLTSFSENDPGAQILKWVLFLLPMIIVLREGMSFLPSLIPLPHSLQQVWKQWSLSGTSYLESPLPLSPWPPSSASSSASPVESSYTNSRPEQARTRISPRVSH
ncbi:hypothetical protein JVT61DRAFT_10235 [Boletus reticuloceps]|uniref:Uncharacterized protein n=1 Tax=Boletus reticuloceps TaxID=495285 RepID=A0A8I2YWF3_9AGAM|nr:hypothetical protein JVT61DRAFT_10235 [Boletus reticuloceps]